jgi:hypothetical protein
VADSASQSVRSVMPPSASSVGAQPADESDQAVASAWMLASEEHPDTKPSVAVGGRLVVRFDAATTNRLASSFCSWPAGSPTAAMAVVGAEVAAAPGAACRRVVEEAAAVAAAAVGAGVLAAAAVAAVESAARSPRLPRIWSVRWTTTGARTRRSHQR